MGNHAVGTAIGLAAIEAVKGRKKGEMALSILDRICAPYQGTDAEFEAINPDDHDSLHPDCHDWRMPHSSMVLGMLMLEAFAPNGLADLDRYRPMLDGSGDEDAACDSWYEEVDKPFSARYKFY